MMSVMVIFILAEIGHLIFSDMLIWIKYFQVYYYYLECKINMRWNSDFQNTNLHDYLVHKLPCLVGPLVLV